jgi:arylsulfatase A-like enzyme
MNHDTNPNVLLLVLDTCRARTFDALLREGSVSGMEQIVQEGTQFTNAMSSAAWTVPSHGSLFTDLYPTEHGSSAEDPYFTPPTAPLAHRLNEVGYTTTGLSANPWISPSFDYDAGFDRFKTADDWFWEGDDLSAIKKFSSRKE